ncbi:MAG: xanthine dehydrogenase family protein molybdopterin-binding subunit, partial [Chloroflexota bacterium]
QTLQASYTTPFETHGSIGPSCAIAQIKDGVATVWSGTQDPSGLRANVAELLNLAMDNVRVICVEASGCYGRNGADPAAIDAVIMAKLAGRPVRVQWMRWDEHGWDPKSPATVHDLVGGFDAKGHVIAWQHEAWMPAQFSTNIIGSILAGHPLGMESNGGFDGLMVYKFPSFTQIQHGEGNLFSHTPESAGIISAWMRSPGQFQVSFAMESFVDELASAAGVDPLDFRLRHLTDPRLITLLKAVAKAANWQPRKSPQSHALTGKAGIATGRGVAITNRGGTLNAQVSEVEVNRGTGEIRVTRVFAGQDNGLTINPRAVKLHMEGAITQAVSRTLLEEVTFDQSNVTSTDWSTYPILTFSGAPEIETLLIDRPDLPATGVGEPSVNPVPASIANAVFDAIGVRIRQLPMRPDRVKAALGQALSMEQSQKGKSA